MSCRVCVSRSDPTCAWFIAWQRFRGDTGDTQGGLIELVEKNRYHPGTTNYTEQSEEIGGNQSYLQYRITAQITSCLLFQWCEVALNSIYLSSPEPNMEFEDGLEEDIPFEYCSFQLPSFILRCTLLGTSHRWTMPNMMISRT